MRQVLGSKTGFSTDQLSTKGRERVIEVADLCQMRKPAEVVRSSLENGACALITGSKFFQGSAFSAATLVPPQLMERLAASASDPATPPLPAGLRDFFARFDVPPSLPHWRSQLGGTINEGLLLRWHTALPLLEQVYALPDGERERIEAEWTARVAQLIEGVENVEVAHSEVGIVSIALTKADGTRCGRDELRLVHRHLATDASGLLAEGGGDASLRADLATRCFIGQPVGFTSEYAVLRLAVGAEMVLDIANGSYDEATDELVLRKLDWLLRNLPELN